MLSGMLRGLKGSHNLTLHRLLIIIIMYVNREHIEKHKKAMAMASSKKKWTQPEPTTNNWLRRGGGAEPEMSNSGCRERIRKKWGQQTKKVWRKPAEGAEEENFFNPLFSQRICSSYPPLGCYSAQPTRGLTSSSE
jgi:hypothetical protein